MGRNKQNCLRLENGNRINKENSNWGNSGKEKLEMQTGTTSFTNRIQEIEERISDTEGKIEERDILLK